MSRPWWKSDSPVNGSERPPNRAGRASPWRARWTGWRRPAFPAVRRPGGRCSDGFRAPTGACAGPRRCPRATRTRWRGRWRWPRWSARCRRPARFLTTAGNFAMALACAGSSAERDPSSSMTPSSDWICVASFAGRVPVVAVLDGQGRVGGAELVKFEAGTPLCAKANERRHHQGAARTRAHGTKAYRDASNDARRAIGDENGISA